MAKTKKITGNTDFTITPKTKNTTYEITANDVLVQFDAGFTTDKGKPIWGYTSKYYNFATKNNNDLVLTTLFTTAKGKAKTVTTTIKNYFADSSANYSLKYKTFRSHNATEAYWNNPPIKPDSVAGYNYLYSPVQVPISANRYLVSTKDNTEFALGGNFQTYIFSQKFNNKYTNHTNKSTIPNYIYDLSGNDEYTLDKGKMYSYDYAGKDTNSADVFLTSTDYAGNDTYELGLWSDFWIDDKKGSDTYTVTGNNDTNPLEDTPRINDQTGNDKYYLSDATVGIVDNGGKDRYEVSNANILSVGDYGKGNDTVIVENSNLEYGESYIANASGNETYKFTNVSFDWETHTENTLPAILDESGKDKYTFNDSSYLDIKDEKGNDTYNINNSNYVIITDEAGNDKYNLKENNGYLDDITITDLGGKDTYTITGTEDDRAGYGKITDSGNSSDKYKFTYCYGGPSSGGNVIDDGGKDSYTIANSYDIDIYDKGKDADKYTVTQSLGWLYDEGGNDTYKIDKLIKSNNEYVWIGDYGGKDSLTLGAKKADLVFMTDYTYNNKSESWGTAFSSLIIYDKTNKGLVRIEGFYSKNNPGIEYSGYGNGRIETIKAGKTTLKDVPDAAYLNSVAQDVISWLDVQLDGSSVMNILQNGSDSQINALIACFEGTQPT